MVVGVALDVISIVQASKPFRRTTQVVTAWTSAGLGWRTVGAGGAALGTFIEPGGGTIVAGANKRAAAIQSLFATAKRNQLNPAAWLTDVIEKLPTWPNKRIDELLPFAGYQFG